MKGHNYKLQKINQFSPLMSNTVMGHFISLIQAQIFSHSPELGEHVPRPPQLEIELYKL